MARSKEFDERCVLEKAVDLFWCKGYNGTSAQDLVDTLAISRSSLYDTFGDKRSLFIKALRYYRQTASRRMIELVNESTDLEATIRQMFQTITQEALEDQVAKGCFMVNSAIELAPHDPEIAALVAQNQQDIEASLTRAIEKGQDAGIFSRKQSALSFARFLFNTISGIRVRAKSGADKQVYEDIVQVTMSALKP